jgi:hypothetical protein
MKLHKFKVLGAGNFPADMLRHGQCWPEASYDAGQIGNFNPSAREVSLLSIAPPCHERWRSFGWKVTESKRI